MVLMKAVPDLTPVTGYVVLHGDLDSLADHPDAVEVLVGDDGRPFSSSVEAHAVARVCCQLAWKVVPVRSAATISRRVVEADRRAS